MMERQEMQADIVVTGFGPAAAGFLTTLAPELAKTKEDGTPLYESKAMPGCPLQVMCYERADDTGFGVSGVVTKAEAIRESFPDFAKEVPNAVEVKAEKTVYLFDHLGCSKRSFSTKFVDLCFKAGFFMKGKEWKARELPFTPPFMDKRGGVVMGVGAFTGWAAQKVMESGMAQIWPGSPVEGPLFDGDRVVGVRLVDQGVEKDGSPVEGAYMPGMDVKAALTVVADGPVGAVGRALDEKFGLPAGHHQYDWGVGMKAVVKLPDDCELEPGTIIHTIGFPEPEIFGFFYVMADKTASLGIFVAPWQDTPVRTTYRYLQHWMQHPYLWRHLKGAKLLSWGAKSIQESGQEGEPFLCGDGYARIGEGSGTTDVLANAGVDEAWASGVMLAKAVLKLLAEGKDFTKTNLEATYVADRRASKLNKRLKKATGARNGFNKSFFWGMFGEGLRGMLGIALPFKSRPGAVRTPELKDALKGRKVDTEKLKAGIEAAEKARKPIHDAVMDACGWPAIPYDGELLMQHQDALLLGGKVQAAPGFADHVRFADPELCKACTKHTCWEICSAQAIMPPEEPGGVPKFDREKCVHCGACIWNCAMLQPGTDKGNIIFTAGSGGLHSNEN